jgi:type II secretory pathway component PulM
MDGLVLLGGMFVFLAAVWVIFIAPAASAARQREEWAKLRRNAVPDSMDDDTLDEAEANSPSDASGPHP